MAVHLFASSTQPLEAAEYIIREARKTQPDALYIIPINSIINKIENSEIHWVVDDLPLTWNKLRLIQTMADIAGSGWEERLEFVFPIIRYHSRWNEVDKSDFDFELNGLKGTSKYGSFLTKSRDVSAAVSAPSGSGELAEPTQKALEQLLDYCDKQKLRVLFVSMPRAIADGSHMSQLETVMNIAKERGYPTLDLLSLNDEIGLDFSCDYYNTTHTNIHGAIKVTDYIARYLKENYDFADKRGDAAYRSWDEAYETYTSKYAGANTLDVEWAGEARDSSLTAPELMEPEVDGMSLILRWTPVAGADGYCVYRKSDSDKKWTACTSVSAGILSYMDTECTAGKEYTYTVIPFSEDGGERRWGGYRFDGVSGEVTAALPAPVLLSLEGDERWITLKWQAVEGADGYTVYRRLPGGEWASVGDVSGSETQFKDTTMLPETTYQYTVRASCSLEGKSSIKGDYDEEGLTWTP